MDNVKTDRYYNDKIISDLSFVLAHTDGLTQDELESNEVLVDSVMFRLIQVSENSGKLSDAFKASHSSIPWRAVKGLRNRIVHEYGNVDMSVIYNTLKNDIPVLIVELKNIRE